MRIARVGSPAERVCCEPDPLDKASRLASRCIQPRPLNFVLPVADLEVILSQIAPSPTGRARRETRPSNCELVGVGDRGSVRVSGPLSAVRPTVEPRHSWIEQRATGTAFCHARRERVHTARSIPGLQPQGTQLLKPRCGVTHDCGDADHPACIVAKRHDGERTSSGVLAVSGLLGRIGLLHRNRRVVEPRDAVVYRILTASQHLMTLHRDHSKAPVGFFRRAFLSGVRPRRAAPSASTGWRRASRRALRCGQPACAGQ